MTVFYIKITALKETPVALTQRYDGLKYCKLAKWSLWLHWRKIFDQNFSYWYPGAVLWILAASVLFWQNRTRVSQFTNRDAFNMLLGEGGWGSLFYNLSLAVLKSPISQIKTRVHIVPHGVINLMVQQQLSSAFIRVLCQTSGASWAAEIRFRVLCASGGFRKATIQVAAVVAALGRYRA